jgi:hypothetical protein
MAERKRMTLEESIFTNKKKRYFDALYPLLKGESLTREQIAKIGNKLSEFALHLIEIELRNNTKTNE